MCSTAGGSTRVSTCSSSRADDKGPGPGSLDLFEGIRDKKNPESIYRFMMKKNAREKSIHFEKTVFEKSTKRNHHSLPHPKNRLEIRSKINPGNLSFSPKNSAEKIGSILEVHHSKNEKISNVMLFNCQDLFTQRKRSSYCTKFH